VLHAEAIPVADAARQLQDGKTPLEHALHDGEDFELVFAVSPDDARRLLATQPVGGVTLFHIGECVESGLALEENGRLRTLDPGGYVHRFE
jgi:thiamine-monophosphate kinase